MPHRWKVTGVCGSIPKQAPLPSSPLRVGIDTLYFQYTRGEAVFPGPCVPVLMLRTDCSLFTLKSAHSSRLLPGSEANAAAIRSYNKEHGTAISIRPVKYLNNIVEQDHRGVKRVTRAMLGFKSFAAAQAPLVGIELMHMIKKRQMRVEAEDEGLTAAEQFYSLAA